MLVLFIALGAATQDASSMTEIVGGLKEPLDLYGWGGSSTTSYSENDYLKGTLVMDLLPVFSYCLFRVRGYKPWNMIRIIALVNRMDLSVTAWPSSLATDTCSAQKI